MRTQRWIVVLPHARRPHRSVYARNTLTTIVLSTSFMLARAIVLVLMHHRNALVLTHSDKGFLNSRPAVYLECLRPELVRRLAKVLLLLSMIIKGSEF